MAVVRTTMAPAAVTRAQLDLELRPLRALACVEQRGEARVGLRHERLPCLTPLGGARTGRPALLLSARQHLDEELLRGPALRLAQPKALGYARELLLPMREALGGRATRGVLGTFSLAVATWALTVRRIAPRGRLLRGGDERCGREREREHQRGEWERGSLLHHVRRHGSILPAGTTGGHARSTWKLPDASYESPNAPLHVSARAACPHDLAPYVRAMGCSFTLRATRVHLAALLALAPSGCSHGTANAAPERPTHARASLPARPHGRATAAFWQHWGDGLAELSGYRATVMRYGAPREAEIVLVYVTEPLDRATLVAGLEICRSIYRQPAFANRWVEEKLPGDVDLESFAQRFGGTVFHPTSTCRMGVDAGAVVDPHLRVRGVQGLRVIDASVMPSVVSCNTNAASIMIGEKGAALLLQ